jgi:antitoxin CptB
MSSPGWSGLLAFSSRAASQMTDALHSGESMDVRRRRLLFRAWHRGMREVDLILGRFADAVLERLPPDELVEFERLIEIPDRELLAWVIGEAGVPANFDTPLFRRLRHFSRNGGA